MELQLGAFGFRLVHFNGPRDQQREAEERIGVGQVLGEGRGVSD